LAFDALDTEIAPELSDNPPGHREPEAGTFPLSLGGKKRIKDL
jgi:hypothetical protein